MGFRGSVNSWTLVSEHGLAAVGRSNHNNWIRAEGHSPNVRGFVMGLDAIPAAWCTYQNWCREREGKEAVSVAHPELFGPSLLNFHRLPHESISPTRLWTIRPDPHESPLLAGLAEDIDYAHEHLPWAVEQLAQRALELIEPGRYLKELLDEPDKGIGLWEPIVVLLSEYGPSSALDDAIAQLKASHAERDCLELTEPIIAYARSR